MAGNRNPKIHLMGMSEENKKQINNLGFSIDDTDGQVPYACKKEGLVLVGVQFFFLNKEIEN